MVCEICGGHAITKRDGRYVCETCGACYAVEEDCGMWRGQVKHPKNDEVKASLERAMQAREAGSYFEAEVCCDRALRIDETDYLARSLKAEVVCLQSAEGEDRTREAIGLYTKALDDVPNDLRDAFRRRAGETLTDLVYSRSVVLANKYSATGSAVDGTAVMVLPFFVQDTASRMDESLGIQILDDRLRDIVARIMSDSAMDVWNRVVVPRYVNDVHRSKTSMDAFVSGGDEAIAIIQAALRFCPNEKQSSIERYQNMMSIQSMLIDAHSMRQDGARWVRAFSLSEASKASRRRDILGWQNEIKKLDPSYEPPTVPRKEPTPSGLQGEAGRRPGESVWNRTVTWRMIVAMFCFARFLSCMERPSGAVSMEAMVWLCACVGFIVWWYRAG